MSIAKALSSAYLPISAVLLSPELVEIIEEEAVRIGGLWHAFTYSAHPVSAAVALKTLELYERRDTFGHVRKVAPHFLKRLRALARSSAGRRSRWRGPDRRGRAGPPTRRPSAISRPPKA